MKHFNKIIYGIIAIVFTVSMCFVWHRKDFGFWCFLISILLIILNLYLISAYNEKHHDKKISTIEQALYIVPAVTLVAIILVTILLPGLIDYSCNKFITVHIVIFAISIIMQLLLFNAAKYNLNQEITIEEKRWSKDETVFQWGKISQSLGAYIEAKKNASKIENEIRYSDPMSSDVLAGLEENIARLTNEVAALSERPEENIDRIVELEKQVLDLVDERNDKCKRLK